MTQKNITFKKECFLIFDNLCIKKYFELFIIGLSQKRYLIHCINTIKYSMITYFNN